MYTESSLPASLLLVPVLPSQTSRERRAALACQAACPIAEMGALLSRLLANPQQPRRLVRLEASPSSPDPFSVNFTVSAHHRKIWIAPDDGSYPETELRVKGTNWAGFQANGCVHELWKHNVSDYIDYLVLHRYNAVRLPISGWIVQQPSFIIEGDYICGRSFAGLESMDILDRVLAALRAAGLFVMLDMHTLSHPEYNNRIWCLSGHSGCSPYWENNVFTAWRILARRYCDQPHVILADLFNEPAGGRWGGGGRDDWASFAERMGNAILEICPRWLIAVQGY